MKSISTKSNSHANGLNLLAAIVGTITLLALAYDPFPDGLWMLVWFVVVPLITIVCVISIIYSLFKSYPKRKYVLGIYLLDAILVLMYQFRPTIYETYEKEQVQVQELVDYSLHAINDSCYAYLIQDTFHPYRNKEIPKTKRDAIGLDDQEYAEIKERLLDTSFTGISIDTKHHLVYLDFRPYIFGQVRLALRRSYSDDHAWSQQCTKNAYNDSVGTSLSGSAL